MRCFGDLQNMLLVLILLNSAGHRRRHITPESDRNLGHVKAVNSGLSQTAVISPPVELEGA
jgi:hypothetical protein